MNIFVNNYKLKQQINRLKNDLLNLKHYYRDNIICQKCMLPIFSIDSDYIINQLLKNNLPIKKLYNETLLPLQNLFILICFLLIRGDFFHLKIPQMFIIH